MMEQIIHAYWQGYCEKTGLAKHTPYTAFAFGDTPKMADTLGKLVKQGKKTGTSSGYDLYQLGTEPIPVEGEYAIVLDSQEQPICVIQIERVEVLPFSKITEEHARKEGEGDLSLAYWRDAHISFLKPYYDELGLIFNDSILIVYETFCLVSEGGVDG